jgi:hypothetical protein
MTGRREWRIGIEKLSPPLVQGERASEAPSVIGAFGVPPVSCGPRSVAMGRAYRWYISMGSAPPSGMSTSQTFTGLALGKAGAKRAKPGANVAWKVVVIVYSSPRESKYWQPRRPMLGWRPTAPTWLRMNAEHPERGVDGGGLLVRGSFPTGEG